MEAVLREDGVVAGISATPLLSSRIRDKSRRFIISHDDMLRSVIEEVHD